MRVRGLGRGGTAALAAVAAALAGPARPALAQPAEPAEPAQPAQDTMMAPVVGGQGLAPAARDAVARFVLIVGVNRSVDPEVPQLRFADDDAARYQELFHALGGRR